jgi:hypothetical protein
VLADLKDARMLANNADNVRKLLVELEARGSDRSSAKPPLRFPASATTPAQIQTVFSNTSLGDLRQMLANEKDPHVRKTLFLEVQRRGKEGLK